VTLPTLTQALAALGYTHRASPTARTYEREILDASGAVIASLTAHDAWALVRRAAS